MNTAGRKRLLAEVWCRAALLCLIGLAGQSAPVAAHEIRPAILDLSGQGERISIQIRLNLESLVAGIPPGHDDTDDAEQAPDYDRLRALDAPALEMRAQSFVPDLLAKIDLRAQGRSLPLELVEWRIPDTGDVRIARDSFVLLETPAVEGELSIGWAEAFGALIVRAGAADSADAFSQYLLAGERSDAFDPGSATLTRSAFATFIDYVRVGFVHIVPRGLDHILFVIGLFLLSARWRPILLQVTAFTLAHSLTLALAALGWVSVPASVVEPLIALSIVVIAVENLFTQRLAQRRLLLVFGFGLLHGLGFASVMADAGLALQNSMGQFLFSLVGFNLGVEIGQLCVVLACLLIVGWYRKADGYRRHVVVPASLAIGATGSFWFLQRLVT